LADRLSESFVAAVDALASVTRPDAEPTPEELANTLLCMLPGYLLQLTIRGADAVKSVPAVLRAFD
jgi:hypothetical protein